MRTGIKSDTYDQDVTGIRLGRVFRRDTKDIQNDLVCTACAAVADAVIAARVLLGASRETLRRLVVELCVDYNIETEEVCEGTIGSNIVSYRNNFLFNYIDWLYLQDIFLYIIDNKADLLGSRVCSIVLQQYECKSTIESNWEVEIPAGYSPASPVSPFAILFY